MDYLFSSLLRHPILTINIIFILCTLIITHSQANPIFQVSQFMCACTLLHSQPILTTFIHCYTVNPFLLHSYIVTQSTHSHSIHTLLHRPPILTTFIYCYTVNPFSLHSYIVTQSFHSHYIHTLLHRPPILTTFIHCYTVNPFSLDSYIVTESTHSHYIHTLLHSQPILTTFIHCYTGLPFYYLAHTGLQLLHVLSLNCSQLLIKIALQVIINLMSLKRLWSLLR